jgi:hypothetical protein
MTSIALKETIIATQNLELFSKGPDLNVLKNVDPPYLPHTSYLYKNIGKTPLH